MGENGNFLSDQDVQLVLEKLSNIEEVEIEEGFSVYVIGIEDLILDRVRAAVHWDSTGDREWALFMINAQWERIDFEYLEQEAQKDKKEQRLVEELIEEVRQYKKTKENDEDSYS